MGASGTLTHPLLLFDGVCNLCNSSVQFIIKRDPKGTFRFAALQSALGQKELQHYQLKADSLESIVLILDGKVWQRSNAALEIARRLSGLWPALYIFKIIPHFIRDWMYDLIANNRYRWFGRQDQCMIPTPELKSRFLD